MQPLPSSNRIKSYIGIDPGASGAVAHLCNNSLTIFDIPAVTVKKGRKLRTRLDMPAFLGIVSAIASLTAPGETVAAIEEVGGLPKQNANASCNFGKTCGAIEMGCVAAGLPVVPVPPGAWKPYFSLIGKDKTASRECAAAIWPALSAQFARVKDDGRAEAALIALYAREKALRP